MGQPIAVVEKPTVVPGVLRFEINRTLTGTGHERYRSADDAVGDRPPDELARRMFAHGGIDAIHMHSNIITVDMAKGGTDAGLARIIETLFIHYTEGVTPSIP
jgi:hypothetical protein